MIIFFLIEKIVLLPQKPSIVAMSNLSLHGTDFSPNTVADSFLTTDRSESDAGLPPLKNFFGHRLTHATEAKHLIESISSLEEARELREMLGIGSNDPRITPVSIRKFEGRSSVHALLANEAREELREEERSVLDRIEQARGSLHSHDLREVSPFSVEDESREEIPQQEWNESTLLPEQLPDSFFSPVREPSFRQFKRKSRRQLAAAAFHEQQAASELRQIRHYEKQLTLIVEHSTSPTWKAEKKVLERLIEQLKESASYHTVKAREIIDRVHGTHLNSPGAHQVVAEGNYELEFPIRPPSPTQRARAISNPNEDLIRFRRGKVESLVQATMLDKNVKKPHLTNLPIAHQIQSPIEIEAVSPKNMKLPEARASLL